MSRFEPTDTHSSIFSNDQEKLCFAQRYFRFFSDVIATEFHIRCVQTSVGGLTFDMRAAFLVAPADVSAWLDVDGDEIEEANLSWADDLIPQEALWMRHSQPRVVRRSTNGSIIAGYSAEGIVVKRVQE